MKRLILRLTHRMWNREKPTTKDELETHRERVQHSCLSVAQGYRLLEEIERLQAIVDPLNRLRDEEGASVEIMCPNPDTGPVEAIEVSGSWTDWRYLRFSGDTLAEVLAAAVKEMDVRNKGAAS